MEEQNQNKTPRKMSRMAWPKSIYGVVLAIIIIIIVNLVYYREKIFSLLS